jgi:hypothetical protein
LSDKSPEAQNIRSVASRLAEDQLYQYLLEKSSLTHTQAETLLYDLMTSHLTSEEKARLRGVSKGSFTRTRQQALRNISQALHTLLLLSYLGIIKLPGYSWFFQLSEAVDEKDIDTVKRMLEELSGMM